ncbi:hypothetical protein [endosymbiont GvMRE of Glomus versiforme]|uniref:hypothetical protein n=1 Tax=endosymbiont GvMRE of Glomus versiforme TaxID=2039283 RepID=UPI000EC43049|nr:hypothetical protein [endosymbiont GvMRE of Glomus versiforme]RHZ36705.1 hypothetical protein GvMRE_I2g67 [endosymbiont GvMRE of Glomus versiforme]
MNPLSKEQLKEYYQKRKEELNQQRTERRRLARLRQKEQSQVETPIKEVGLRQLTKNKTTELKNIGLRQVETQKEVETLKTSKEVETMFQAKNIKASQPEIKEKIYETENNQEYNQALEKLKEQWAKQEKGECVSYKVEPITSLHFCNACDYHQHRNETKPWSKVKVPVETPQIESKLWSDYYDCLKPFCKNCQEKGIKENEYAFCSQEKAPVTAHTFNEIYACNVYHWTINQRNTNKKVVVCQETQ